MSINEIKDVVFENYYKRIAFSKESSCFYSMKHLKKKDLLLLESKLIEKKCPILAMLKNTINHF